MNYCFISGMHKINQAGSASLLFAVFVIPILMVIGSVVVDVEAYTQRRQLLQSTVDEATLFGSKYLPNKTLAKTATVGFLSQKVPNVSSAIDITSDEVRVNLTENFMPMLAGFFKGMSSAQSLFSIPVVTSAIGRISPIDLYIAVDRGRDTAPPLLSAVHDRYGTPGEFPLPHHFNSQQFLYGNTVVVPEIALEQCHNPRLTAIKQMAVRALDLVRGAPVNRAAVSFFPGAINVVGQNARLSDVANQKPVSLLDSHLEWDQSHHLWVEEAEPAAYFPVKSQDCLSVLQDAFSASTYHPDMPTYDADANQLTLSHVVWSRVASQQTSMDAAVVMSDLSQQLFSSTTDDTRGALVNSMQQIALVFTEGAPKVGGMMLQSEGDSTWTALSMELEKIRAHKQVIKTPLSIYYFMSHASPSTVSLLQELFDSFAFSQGSRQIFSATAVNVDSLSHVVSQTLPFIIRGGQRAVIKQ